MPNQTILFTGDKVALVVRGKKRAGHSPGKLEQHADAAKSTGAPVGFFGGEGGSGSSGSSVLGILSAAVLFGVKGEVFELDEFEEHRPHYVNLGKAIGAGMMSTVLTVRVTTQAATRFDEYWAELKADPKTFSLLGRNCSTRASGAFRHAGILNGGIPGLDTPDNLYKQLVKERPDLCQSYSGYVGFEQMVGGNRMAIVVNTPDPG